MALHENLAVALLRNLSFLISCVARADDYLPLQYQEIGIMSPDFCDVDCTGIFTSTEITNITTIVTYASLLISFPFLKQLFNCMLI